MKTRKLIIALSMAVFMVPVIGQARTQANMRDNCVERPVSDFLAGQGTASVYFPPVPDYAGWTGPAPTYDIFALVDYAGLADPYIQKQSGYGNGRRWKLRKSSMLECPLENGKAEIKLYLDSDKAMGFAQSMSALEENGWNFLITPTIFGRKVQDSSGKFAFGSATLSTTFTIAAPGGTLPDFISVLNEIDSDSGKLKYGPVTFDFKSATQGPPPAPGCLKVHQVAATNADGTALVWTTEIVQIDPKPCP